jgi:hypothetical protein
MPSDRRWSDDAIMTMYLSNAEIGPVGAEVAEFIDYPRTFDDLAAEGRSATPERSEEASPSPSTSAR